MLADVNGVKLFYTMSGAGKPLLLLHGNSQNHKIFDKISRKLKERFTLYALDSRNHGESGKNDDISYEAMTEDVHAFVNELGIAPVNLIGFSDGAIIGAMLAMKHPGDAEKMALLGPNLSPEDLTEEFVLWLKGIMEKHPSRLLDMILEEPHIDPEDLKKITCPTLVVFGDDDIVSPEKAREISRAIPGSEFLEMKGHGHESHIVDNDLMAETFIEFFER
ncbi:MAG: alpha/beta hydrolase [Deltaproteobacteria bacterium]|jgi:pimeloyl-ACP methyl ester carboxylesterase|nr:alpha/beta hydrolase [Deltaproteobacteria bacterium]